jgi:autotransporter-associated beta strand protein
LTAAGGFVRVVHAQQVVVENFTSLTNWTVGTQNGNFTPSVTSDSWLRMTDSGGQEATYAVYNTSFASTNTSVYVDFLFRFYNGTSFDNKLGDGITFFLYDASQTFSAGFYGGSLGYANYNGGTQYPNLTKSGMAGGYLGIGIDQFGNYSNSWDEVSNARNGGPGVTPSSIAVRGPGSGQTGYEYLGGTSTLPASLWSTSTTAPTSGDGFGHMIISISPTNQLVVSLARDSTSTPTVILTMDLSSFARPEDLRFGFTASTGGATSIHELSELTFASVPAHRWDRGAGTNDWGTGDNWNPATTPIAQADVLLDNTWVSTNQTINVGAGQTRTIRTLYIDAPFNYTLENGTLNFNGGSSASTSGIIVSASNGSGATQNAVNSAITMNNNIVISNSSAANLSIGGTIANSGNMVTLAGTSSIDLNGVISGTGALQKTGTNTVTLNAANTYTGDTIIKEGTLKLGASDRISNSSNLNVAGGTLDLNGHSERVNNLTFSNNGSIDFGTTGTTNYFLFNNITTSPSGVITISNWEQAQDILAAQNTLSAAVLSQFYFAGYGTGATQGTTGQTVGSYGGGWLLLNPVAAVWYTWDGSSSNRWTTGSNWDRNSVPTSGAKVAFGTTNAANRNVDLRANNTVNAVRFNADANGAYNIGNGSSTYTLTMGGTGTAFIQQKSSSYAQTISAPVALANNTVVDMIGTQSLTMSGALSGSGNLVKEGTGGDLILSGNNSSYSGNIYINAGTVQVNSSTALGNTTGNTIIADGATLEVTNNISTDENIDIDGAGVSGGGVIRSVSGSNTLSGTINLTDAATLDADSGSTLTVSGSLVSSSGRVLTVTGAGSTNISGPISTGSGGLTKDGTGTLTLSGSNSFRGDMTINSGTVTLGSSERINDTVAVNTTGGTFNLANYSETVGSLSGTAGSITLGSGTLTTGGNDASTTYAGIISGTGNLVKQGSGTMTLSGGNTYTGTTTINAGTLSLGANHALSNSTAVSIASGATFDVNGKTETIASVTSTGGTLNIGTGALTTGTTASMSFSGAITGTGSLIKQGSGTMTIASNIDFGGTILVNAGTLALSAGATIQNLTLASGTTLKLSGTGTTYNIGTLTLTGTCTIDFGSGSVTLDANALSTSGTINITNWTNLQDYFYASTWNGNDYDDGIARGQTPLNQIVFSGYNGSNTAWIPIGGQGQGQITPVPETGTYGALFMGSALGLVGINRWSKRRKNTK